MCSKKAALAALAIAAALASPVQAGTPDQDLPEAHAYVLMQQCWGASRGDLDWLPSEYLDPALFNPVEISVLTTVCEDIVRATDPYPWYWEK